MNRKCCCLCFSFAMTFSHDLLFMSPAEVAHQFQYAVRVIGSNYAPTIERDEFLVSEKIKKECKCPSVTEPLSNSGEDWSTSCPSLLLSGGFVHVHFAFYVGANPQKSGKSLLHRNSNPQWTLIVAKVAPLVGKHRSELWRRKYNKNSAALTVQNVYFQVCRWTYGSLFKYFLGLWSCCKKKKTIQLLKSVNYKRVFSIHSVMTGFFVLQNRTSRAKMDLVFLSNSFCAFFPPYSAV